MTISFSICRESINLTCPFLTIGCDLGKIQLLFLAYRATTLRLFHWLDPSRVAGTADCVSKSYNGNKILKVTFKDD